MAGVTAAVPHLPDIIDQPGLVNSLDVDMVDMTIPLGDPTSQTYATIAPNSSEQTQIPGSNDGTPGLPGASQNWYWKS